MSEASGTPRHVTIEQLKLMVDFMGQHVDFASGKLRTLEARYKSKALWKKLSALLNDCSGVKKTSNGWSKFWSDWKNKLKNKMQLLKKKDSDKVKLSSLEKRALEFLGPDFHRKRGHLGNGTASYENSYSNDTSPTIKLETDQDDDNSNASGDEQTRDDNSESNHDDVYESDPSTNDLLQNLYPKWLIEVEKKRADAELLRAKAEERRASVAAKGAEAALVQANALKKLAEATSNQADALMRIALVLEARGERDLLEI